MEHVDKKENTSISKCLMIGYKKLQVTDRVTIVYKDSTFMVYKDNTIDCRALDFCRDGHKIVGLHVYKMGLLHKIQLLMANKSGSRYRFYCLAIDSLSNIYNLAEDKNKLCKISEDGKYVLAITDKNILSYNKETGKKIEFSLQSGVGLEILEKLRKFTIINAHNLVHCNDNSVLIDTIHVNLITGKYIKFECFRQYREYLIDYTIGMDRDGRSSCIFLHFMTCSGKLYKVVKKKRVGGTQKFELYGICDGEELKIEIDMPEFEGGRASRQLFTITSARVVV